MRRRWPDLAAAALLWLAVLPAAAFGQGKDLVNPLSQASVVAAIGDGTWRPPQLVTSPAPRQAVRPHKLPAPVLDALRPMMRAPPASSAEASVSPAKPVNARPSRVKRMGRWRSIRPPRSSRRAPRSSTAVIRRIRRGGERISVES